MIILENEELIVELAAKGAEIISIVGKKDGMNYMWKRDKSLWANSAPTLFPMVGRVKNNQYRVDGKIYELTSHGFARHTEFDIVESSATRCVMSLSANEATLAVYPYLFKLDVVFTLDGSSLKVETVVTNTDNKEIYFGIGGHPAFACPMFEDESSNDYYLEFNEFETKDRKTIDETDGLFTHKVIPFLDNEKRFFLRQELFLDDAIIIEEPKSNSIALKSLNHNKQVIMEFNNYNHYGIWASHHVGGLIALEPWVGHGDYQDFDGEWKDKAGIKALDINKTFACDHTIKIIQ